MTAKKNHPTLRESRGIQHKALDTFVQAVEDRTVRQIFSVMGNVDDGGDVIHTRAFEKTLAERFDQVRTLWQHDGDEPPIGVPLDLREIGRADLPEPVLAKYPDCEGALLGVIEYLDTPRGNEVLTGIKRGAIKKNSIGYSAVKFDYQDLGDEVIRHLREVVLWDVSPVNWGMNEATLNLKMAQPFRDTGIADEQTLWCQPSLSDFTVQEWLELSEPELKRILGHFAWTADSDPRSFADLKLAHHLPSKEGKGKAVWSAVQAAMHALIHLDMPDEDRRAVYDHLAKHYEQFGKAPLPWALIETCREATILGLLTEELKVGRMISAANLGQMQSAVIKIKEATVVLDDLIVRATPVTEPVAELPTMMPTVEPTPTEVVTEPRTPLAEVPSAPTLEMGAGMVPTLSTPDPITILVSDLAAPAEEPTPITNILDVPPTLVPINTLTLARMRALGITLRNKD